MENKDIQAQIVAWPLESNLCVPKEENTGPRQNGS
jgi:hypothetical protein